MVVAHDAQTARGVRSLRARIFERADSHPVVMLALFLEAVLDRVRQLDDARATAVLYAPDEQAAALARVLLFRVPHQLFVEPRAESYHSESPQNSSLR